MSKPIEFRLATLDDAEMLLRWRNDEKTRSFSLQPKKITKKQHMSWLRLCLADPKRQLFVAIYSEQPIGSVRIESTPLGQLISWTLAPEFRGRGLGKAMVKSLVSSLKGKIVAEILPRNIASIKVASYAGLEFKSTNNGIMRYEYYNTD
jgi:RimJ/RimL family protein N-acetyltransferase